MIHYHGTPIGGTRDEVARFLRNRHAFISFANPEDIAVAADMCQSFALDNGAFTIWKRGGKLDWKAYCDWVDEWVTHPGFDFAVCPDVIEGNYEENGALIGKVVTHRPKTPWAYVWHYHEPLTWLDTLVQRCAMGNRKLCLGSSGEWPTPGTDKWWDRTNEAFEVICDEEGRPRCKVHGLRMLSLQIYPHLPLASADSTNVAQNANSYKRFGTYKPPTRSQRAAAIADYVEAANSPSIWVKAKEEQLLLFR